MFGMLKKSFGAAAKEVKAEYGENKDFLEAVCAVAALVAAADGEIEEAEKRKTIAIITGHKTLGKLYQQNVIEQTADQFFRQAKDASGRNSLARELDDIKGRPNGIQMAEDAYLIGTDIAMSDGELEPQETEVLKKIANRLGIDTSKFEF